MKRTLSLVLFFTYASVFSAAEEFTARVTSVIDGNTFEVTGQDNGLQRFVLAGIDSPEPGQPYAEKAKRALEDMILNKEVRIQVEGKNRWGQYLAIVTIVRNNKDPRIELLKEGLAWTSEKNPIADLEAIRLSAEQKGKGIWQDENPTPPWIYRREQSMMQAKSS